MRNAEWHDVLRCSRSGSEFAYRFRTPHSAFRIRRSMTARDATLNPIAEKVERAERLTRDDARSEEHTSELQSHLNLVCRLLLEKKNLTHGKRRRRNAQDTRRTA